MIQPNLLTNGNGEYFYLATNGELGPVYKVELDQVKPKRKRVREFTKKEHEDFISMVVNGWIPTATRFDGP